MIYPPSDEQQDIFNYIKNDTGNLLVEAFAGCAKTYTAVESTKLLPEGKSIMFLAFNKHNQLDFKSKLPEHVKCYTTYGLGYAAIKKKYGDKIEFDEFKIDKIIQKKAKTWKLEEEFEKHSDISVYLKNIKKLSDLCRKTLTTKPEYIPALALEYDINLKEKQDIKRVLKVLDETTNDRKTFDFIDSVYLPAIDNGIWMFPQDYVYVDEYQDLNLCQLRILEKILKKDKTTGNIIGRLFAFGDKFQGVYLFNGANSKVTDWFKKFPNTKSLPLSTSFRCSKSVIAAAQRLVPGIKARENAPEGSVRDDGDVLMEAQNGDYVLCRTTIPLIKLFFEFLVQGKKAIIKGAEIGVDLINLIGKIDNIDKLNSFWTNELSSFKKDIAKSGILNPEEHSEYVTLEDKVNTLLFLAKLSVNITDLKVKIKTIFSDELQGIILSSVHKAKGLESKNVFIIRPDLLPMKQARGGQWQQERNLEYISITRAIENLIYDNNWSDIKK